MMQVEQELDRFTIRPRPCLRSGLCCKKGPCGYGTWDASRSQCAHLVVERVLANGAEIHACAIHDEIVKQPGAEMSPAFGAGCCMPMFNQYRDAIAQGLREEADD
jgi:hypothetical protein